MECLFLAINRPTIRHGDTHAFDTKPTKGRGINYLFQRPFMAFSMTARVAATASSFGSTRTSRCARRISARRHGPELKETRKDETRTAARRSTGMIKVGEIY